MASLTLDRVSSNTLTMTQELIASMLGVRREGVTEAARHLQAAGLIHYSRGHITVLDRLKLEERVCECYAVVKKNTGRLLPEMLAIPRAASPCRLISGDSPESGHCQYWRSFANVGNWLRRTEWFVEAM